MQEVTFNLKLQTVPNIMTRERHALILIQDEQGRYVLGQKKFYPEGIARMVGGGIDANEEPQLAAARELEEEVGVKVSADHLKPLAKVTAHITNERFPHTLTFVTYIYFATLKSQDLKFDSDLDGLAFLTPDQYKELLNTFTKLPTALGDHNGEGVLFSWSDYAQLYGPIHQLALELSLPH